MIFTEELAAKIIRGEKTATRRRRSPNRNSPWYSRKCGYRVDQVFTINPGRGVRRVAEAKVTNVFPQELRLAHVGDARKEGFRTLAQLRDRFTEINGEWRPAEKVWVIEFHLVGGFCLGCDGCGWCEGSPAWTCTDCFGTGRAVSPAARELLGRHEP
jgi:hypothetical protein